MMDNDNTELHAETDAARAGSTPNIVRWILVVSLLAAIVLLSIIWITGAATQEDEEENVSVSRTVPDETRGGESTDSIVGENADEFETAEPGQDDAPGVPTIENKSEAPAAPAQPPAN